MNPRAFLIRASLVVAFVGLALAVAVIAPRSNSASNRARTTTASTALFPLIALPLVHALLSP
jgi:hypothetical protein